MLTFNQASYSGVACGTITGAYVTATVGGVPTAGVNVTTTLSGGYTFAGGVTTNTQISGSDGRVNLPAVNVPSVGGSGTLGALAGSSVANATTTAPVAKNATYRSPSGSTSTFAFPFGTTSPTGGTFLTPTGDLYLESTTTKIASNVVDAYSHAESNVGWWVTYIRADGTGASYEPGGTSISVSLPSGTKVAGLATFLTPAGDLYLYSTQLASNVSSAGGVGQNTIGFWTSWVLPDGSASVREPGGAVMTYTYPAGTTSPTAGTFLTPAGDLYLYSTLIASKVVDAYSHAETNVGWWITYIRDDGTGGSYEPGGSTITVSLPPGTTVVGLATFLTSTGDLYSYSTKIASDVTSAGAVGQNVVGFWTTWISTPAC